LRVEESVLAGTVFPGSAEIKAMSNLLG
jgi:hypothetical protein